MTTLTQGLVWPFEITNLQFDVRVKGLDSIDDALGRIGEVHQLNYCLGWDGDVTRLVPAASEGEMRLGLARMTTGCQMGIVAMLLRTQGIELASLDEFFSFVEQAITGVQRKRSIYCLEPLYRVEGAKDWYRNPVFAYLTTGKDDYCLERDNDADCLLQRGDHVLIRLS